MKTSCIRQPANSKTTVIREGYSELFGGDHRASVLLSFLQWKADLSIQNGLCESPIYLGEISLKQVQSLTLGSISDKRIRQLLSEFEERGYVISDRDQKGHCKHYWLVPEFIQEDLDELEVEPFYGTTPPTQYKRISAEKWDKTVARRSAAKSGTNTAPSPVAIPHKSGSNTAQVRYEYRTSPVAIPSHPYISNSSDRKVCLSGRAGDLEPDPIGQLDVNSAIAKPIPVGYQSSAERCNASFARKKTISLQPWETGDRVNPVSGDSGFLKYLVEVYLPKTPHYEGKSVTKGNAVTWIKNRDSDEVAAHYQDYQDWQAKQQEQSARQEASRPQIIDDSDWTPEQKKAYIMARIRGKAS